MNIELTDKAVNWFKDELDLPEANKVLQFYVRYGGEFQLKQGFSPAFNVEQREDIEIGFEKSYNGLNVVVAEKDLWYFQDDEIKVDVVNHEDEISYSKSKNDPLLNHSEAGQFNIYKFSMPFLTSASLPS